VKQDGAARAVLEVGAVFDKRYRVVRCLKAGGMGAVYEVVHLETQRRRALKVMLPEFVTDPALRERFRLEATVAADIESDHIVETFDAGVDAESGSPFLVMELLRGADLAELATRRALVPIEVVALLGQAALALAKTHERGIVHRDLKPENLYLTFREDGTPRLKILDFGIAKLVRRSTIARATQSVGTPPFMSPEQIEGTATLGPATDHYALAHIAYALLVQRVYFESPDAMSVLAQALRGPTQAPSVRAARYGVKLPPTFDLWFKRAAALDPAARFSSAQETVAMLARAFGVHAFDAAARQSATGSFVSGLDVVLRAARDSLFALWREVERVVAVRVVTGPQLGKASAPTEQPVASSRVRARPSVGFAGVAAVALAVVLGALVSLIVLRSRNAPVAASVAPASTPAGSTSASTSASASPAPSAAPSAATSASASAAASVTVSVAPTAPSAASATARAAAGVGKAPPRHGRAAPASAQPAPLASSAPAPVDPTRSR
jgi:serine/threonine-protein kinase